jgi:hypothetical protein
MKQYRDIQLNIVVSILFITSCSFLLLPILIPSVAANEPTWNKENIIKIGNQIGLTPNEIDLILDKQTVSKNLTDANENELGVLIAFTIKHDLKSLYQKTLSGDFLQLNKDLIETVELTQYEKAIPDDLDLFDNNDISELKKLLKMNTISENHYNFSEEELRSLENLQTELNNSSDNNNIEQQLTQFYKNTLNQRYIKYRTSGIKNIAPYVHKKKIISPGNELDEAAKKDRIVIPNRIFFLDAYHHYPEHDNENIKHQFYLMKLNVEGRPDFILSHRMFLEDNNVILMAEREYYVGHTYSSQHKLIGAIPYDGHSLVFYINRTFTDRITGFGNGLKRNIGSGMMRDEIIEQFNTIKSSVNG